jgi:SAM-dependent methyltransferase
VSEPLQRRQQAWTRYWQSGASHSCGTSYGVHYGGPIAAFWRGVQDRTAIGSRLLDVASGSAAIPRLWRSGRLGDTWHAVDLAALAPAWVAEAGPGFHFHPGVRAEALPFPDASFDLVTSQYGLEYCDLLPAVREVLRVRAPAGRIALVLHHSASRPVQLARVELAHLDWALGPEGLVAAGAAMIDPVAQARTAQGRARLISDPAAERIRLHFNAAQSALGERARQAPDGADVLGEVRDSVGALLQIAMSQGAGRAHERLSSWLATMADHRLRLAELCSHALDTQAVQGLQGQMESADLQAELGTLHEGPHLMGWTLCAQPS